MAIILCGIHPIIKSSNQILPTSAFLNRCPTEEDILRTCNTLAEKLSADINAKNDVKLALMDLLEEALQDVMDYEPDADMVFNYLMVSALAEATDLIEKKGMKPSGKDLQDLARKVIYLVFS